VACFETVCEDLETLTDGLYIARNLEDCCYQVYFNVPVDVALCNVSRGIAGGDTGGIELTKAEFRHPDLLNLKRRTV
jgi:hypothetical protein